MQIGIFAKTFERPSLAATLDAVLATGLHVVQFNMVCAGLPSMPDSIDPTIVRQICAEHAARQISMAAVSGTYNIIHPDHTQRVAGLRRLEMLASVCHMLGTKIITISSGTRNTDNMWHSHPDNATAEAWEEMLIEMHKIAAIGEKYGVNMAFEPEVSNVVSSASQARQLLDTIGSPALKVVMDGANLFPAGSLPRMQAILEEACGLLGPDIVLAHAKDLSHDGEAGHEAAGQGMLDYPCYLRQLERSGYHGPIILHSLSESQAPGSIAFLQNIINTSDYW